MAVIAVEEDTLAARCPSCGQAVETCSRWRSTGPGVIVRDVYPCCWTCGWQGTPTPTEARIGLDSEQETQSTTAG